MITVVIGKFHKMESDAPYPQRYTDTADVVMWVGNSHHCIGALRQRYSDDKFDFDPNGELLADEKEWAVGFEKVSDAKRWLEVRLNARELIAAAQGKGLCA